MKDTTALSNVGVQTFTEQATGTQQENSVRVEIASTELLWGGARGISKQLLDQVVVLVTPTSRHALIPQCLLKTSDQNGETLHLSLNLLQIHCATARGLLFSLCTSFISRKRSSYQYFRDQVSIIHKEITKENS